MRLLKNPLDPLFRFDGSDDGQGHGISRMLFNATILITIPLPPNVRIMDIPGNPRSVVLRRGIPTTLNTPGLDKVLMSDGREPDLPTQALHAIQQHDQPKDQPTTQDLTRIAQFEVTSGFFSSTALQKYFQGGPAPVLPAGNTTSEKRGRRFFIDAPFVPTAFGGDGSGSCAACHSGPMLNKTNQFLPLPDPPGTRFLSIGVSEGNLANNPIHTYIFTDPATGAQASVSSPDPGRALITGKIDGDPTQGGAPFFTSLNAFKIPILWGVKNTAPYFHDNSARTLEDVVSFYTNFVFPKFGLFITQQDQTDIVAYMKLL